jgi:pimeloyl-ACP methyl ester carboxylesterase
MTGWTSEAAVARVLWTLDWVQRHYPVDPDRVSLRGESMGGMGSVIIALQHPERFAAIHAYVPVFSFRNSSMMAINPIEYVKAHPEIDFPFIMYTAGRTDHIVGWPDKLEFAHAAEQGRHPFIFYWDPRGHTYAGKVPVVWGEPNGVATAPLPTFSRNQSFPAIADLTANSDPGTLNQAVRPDQRPPLDSPGAGDLVGSINGMVTWEKIADTANRYEITLRLALSAKAESATATITPRRMKNFKPAPNARLHYRVTGAGKPVLGEVSADGWGHVTVRGVPITKAGNRLEIW